ncbi:pyridoxamine 5'-phosphate oxidase [Angustibacter peucedani]
MSDGVVDPRARLDYDGELLDVAETGSGGSGAPLSWIERWYADAQADERVDEPGAMVVATVDAEGLPDARTVLLKGLSPEGLTFFTNTRSAKGHQLAGAPYAALVLLWHPMYRQIRVRGPVRQTSPEEAAAYFASRPRGSQVATRASRQSQPISSRAELEARVAAEDDRWPSTGSPDDVPAPSTWGGYVVRPDVVELWVGQRSRLHDRLVFRRTSDGGLDDPHAWRSERLQP